MMHVIKVDGRQACLQFGLAFEISDINLENFIKFVKIIDVLWRQDFFSSNFAA